MKKNVFLLLSALLLAVGCSSLPKVYNVEKKTVVLTGGQTMQNAILIGGASKHWVMTAVRPGLIVPARTSGGSKDSVHGQYVFH